MPYSDCHIHLQDPLFRGDLDEVLHRGKECGVEHFFCNGTEPNDWETVCRLAAEHEEIVPFYGLHPWYVEQSTDWEETLIRFLETDFSDEKYRPGIGEIGLDFFRKPKNDAMQIQAFRRQLQIAKKRELPVSLHTVRAMNEMVSILREEGPFPAILLHSFSGPIDRVEQLQKLGCFFSFSAALLKSKNNRIREAAVAVPENRILLESDAPALAPQYGQRNEPTVVPAILAELAALRAVPEERLRETVYENSRRFLRYLRRGI